MLPNLRAFFLIPVIGVLWELEGGVGRCKLVLCVGLSVVWVPMFPPDGTCDPGQRFQLGLPAGRQLEGISFEWLGLKHGCRCMQVA